MKNRILGYITAMLFIAFLVLTLFIKNFDVQSIGPMETRIGLSALNQFVFNTFGVNLFWYHVTDWLGLAAVIVACGFAVLGLFQLIRRRSLKKVDSDILLLGIFYLAVIGCYIFFEEIIINYRPVLIEGKLEASYPSSHTMIVVCIMVTSMLQLQNRVKKKPVLWITDSFSVLIIAVTVIGRLFSGVHWFTDITGGLLLSSTLTMLYYLVYKKFFRKR